MELSRNLKTESDWKGQHNAVSCTHLLSQGPLQQCCVVWLNAPICLPHSKLGARSASSLTPSQVGSYQCIMHSECTQRKCICGDGPPTTMSMMSMMPRQHDHRSMQAVAGMACGSSILHAMQLRLSSFHPGAQACLHVHGNFLPEPL